MSTEELTQWTKINLWHDKEVAAFEKETVSDQSVKMRVKPCIVAEGLNCHYNPRYPDFLAKGKLEELR